jgi:nitrogen fixation NifU-like protein
MIDDLYQQHILDHAQHPRHYGRLETNSKTNLTDNSQSQNDANSADQSAWQQTVEMANLSCGDEISVDVSLDKKGIIKDIAWRGDGCAISRAAASIISEWAVGKPLRQVQDLSVAEIATKLGLESLSQSRIKCARLLVVALQKVSYPPKD